MKIAINIIKSLFLLLIAGTFASCEKESFVESSEYVIPQDNAIRLKILTVAPEAPAVNFFINDKKITGVNNATGINNGYGYNGLYPDLGYLVVNNAAAYNLKAKVAGAASEDADLTVLDQNLNLEDGKQYTLFTSKYDATNKKISNYTLIEDKRPTPTPDTSKTYIRLVNLLNDVSGLTLEHVNVEKVLVNNLPYGEASDFISIDNPGQANEYKLINAADGSSVLNITSYTLVKGRCLTIYCYGNFGEAGTYSPKLAWFTSFY